MIISPEKTILSVSQLNRRAKQLLETHLPLIWVSGEISNLAQPSSGHWYFSLKDNKAQVRCAMFRNTNQRLRWQPQSGQQVLIRARVSLYEGRGEYQLIAEHMEAAGAGQLQQHYEILKAKLHAEGLFEESRKQVIPSFSPHIAVITSPTGAAIHDILQVLKRRSPMSEVTIIPVNVQGNTAAAEMAEALKKVEHYSQINKHRSFDVIIIGRGGGSIEDLWAFNDENLARSIAQCPIPVVSAVGHEVDFTIADFVADLRAPTPSASAEMISPDINEWQQTIDVYFTQLQSIIRRKIEQKTQKINFYKKRLRHPSAIIQQQKQQLLLTQQSLQLALRQRMSRCKEQLRNTSFQLHQHHPTIKIEHRQQQLIRAEKQLKQHINSVLAAKQQQLAHKVQILNAVNPLQVLARGYAVVSQKSGQIMKNTKSLSVGDELSTQLAQGTYVSVVKKILPD